MEVNKRIVEVCDWETVEQLTRKGKMADHAKWLGEGVIYIEPDGTDEDALFSECKVTDAPEKIADAIIEVLKDK